MRAHRRSSFELLEVLGAGAYGAVFKASLREDPSQLYSIKVVRKSKLNTEQKRRAASTEKEVLLQCNHPAIVKLHCTFQDAEHLYYCMEYLPNRDLFHLVKTAQKLGPPAAAALGLQIVGALEYLHGALHVEHRDLKPENILLDDHNNIRLIDFGASVAYDRATWRTQAAPAAATTTIQYLPPECFADAAEAPAAGGPPGAIDLWALGCTLYYMLCGRTPFAEPSDYLTIQRIKRFEVEWPPDLDPLARDLIERLWRADPTQRLGIGSFAALKQHPFFAHDPAPSPMKGKGCPVAGGSSLPRDESPRKTRVHKAAAAHLSPAEIGRLNLFPGEKALYVTRVYKWRKLSVKKRNLILTDTPRLFYTHPVTGEVKGEIHPIQTISVSVISHKLFNITTPTRTYHLQDQGHNAQAWADAVRRVQGGGPQTVAEGVARDEPAKRA